MNIALFVTHSLFMTEEQIAKIASGEGVELTGHCVPVWVDAKTGRTTEPAKEIFCSYLVHNSSAEERDIRLLPKKGYEIFLPNSSKWSPPPPMDYEKISLWSSEDRQALVREIDKWWFSNPRPMDLSDLARGYLRFDIRKTNKIRSKTYPEQHVVEIALWDRLFKSLAT